MCDSKVLLVHLNLADMGIEMCMCSFFTYIIMPRSMYVKPYNYIVHTNDAITKHMFSDMEQYHWLTCLLGNSVSSSLVKTD